MGDKTTALIFLVKDQASAAVKHLESNLASLSHRADLGGRAMSGLQNILKGVGYGIGIGGFQELDKIIGKITDAIPALITKGIGFGESVNQISLATGASAQQVSRLLGSLQYLGISTENLGQTLGRVAKNAIAHAEALAKVGINIGSTNTGFDNQITILDKLRSSLNDVTGGTARQALLQAILGRNAAVLTEYLALTNDQVALLNTEMDKLGVTIDEQGVLKAEAASKEFNLFGLSVQGVANRLISDVAPALVSAVDGIANFVAENGKAIAAFAADVVNFVFGMIDALTGANLAAVPFTAQMEQLANITTHSNSALDDFATKTAKAKDGTAAATRAINDKIAALKAEDAAADKLYGREISGLTKTLDLEVRNLDASLKARHDKESQVQLAQQLIDAEQALAEARAGTNGVVDPAAVTQAYKAVQAVVQQQGDAQIQAGVDARKAEIDGVKTYVASIEQALKDSTNKKALIHQLDKDAASLASQQTAAKLAGNLQRVADLDVELQAVRTTKARAQDVARTTSAEAALQKQLDKLKDAGSVVDNTFHTALQNVDRYSSQTFGSMGDRIGGLERQLTPGGLVGGMNAVSEAGRKMGESIKEALATVAGTVGTIVDVLGQFNALIGGITPAKLGIGLAGLGAVTGNIPLAIAGLALMGISLGPGLLNATTPTGGARPGYYVGKQIPGTPETPNLDFENRVRPPGMGNTITITINSTSTLDGEKVAHSVSKHLFGEAQLSGALR